MLKKVFLALPIFVISLCFANLPNEYMTPCAFKIEQKEQLDVLTQAIDGFDAHDKCALHLLNERGLSFCSMGEFDNAIADFNCVLACLSDEQPLELELIGVAIWGRLFCHAFKNELQETYEDSLLIQSLFLGTAHCDGYQQKEHSVPISHVKNDFQVIPVAKFAYPEEKVSPWECHDRTKILASKMRSLADLIPEVIVRNIVLKLIGRLADGAHECCEKGQHWTECLGPIADVWKKLDDTWDRLVDLFKKGIKIEKFLVGPNNL